MNQAGQFLVNLNIANYFSSLTFSTNIVVSNAFCFNPILSITNRSSLFYSPTIYNRSNLFFIETTTVINCTDNLNNTKTWFIYKTDPLSGARGAQVKLTNNPTVNYAEIVIQPNSLSYGLYRFLYQVSMSGPNTVAFMNQIDTYIKIIPSGIVVSAFNNGLNEIRRGLSQNIVLDPVTNSYDLDNLISTSALNFKFYCQILDDGIARGFSYLTLHTKIDLLMFKKNPSLSNSIFSCFNDKCKF